jgi:putative hydrolase of HD superfamily
MVASPIGPAEENSPVGASKLDGILAFLRSAERLKDTLRSSHTSSGRPESAAEHTWRLCLMAVLLRHEFPEVDFAKLIRICVIHDLGEAVRGDIPATSQTATSPKAAQERLDLLEILAPLPRALRTELLELWDEYESATSAEARLAKALDKLETIMQHNQGLNPADFDYGFNLGYGQQYTAAHPLIVAFRAALDRETQRRAHEQAGRQPNT